MNKLNLTEVDAVLLTLNNIADFLNQKSELHSFNVNSNDTTTAVYNLDNHFIVVKRDVNNCAFSIQFHLKRYSTVCGEKIDPYDISTEYAQENECPF